MVKVHGSTEECEKALQNDREKCVLPLYVNGMTSKSLHAFENLKKICEEEFKERYELEVVDIRRNPELAKDENIIALPALVKKLPLPVRNLIGDMSNKEKILVGLDLVPKNNALTSKSVHQNK